jgi:hypothetical protein
MPDLFHKAVFEDEPAAFAEQKGERIEIATVHVEPLDTTEEQAFAGIEREITEAKAAPGSFFSSSSCHAHAAHTGWRQDRGVITTGRQPNEWVQRTDEREGPALLAHCALDLGTGFTSHAAGDE